MQLAGTGHHRRHKLCRVIALVRAQRNLGRLVCRLLGIGHNRRGDFGLGVATGSADYGVGDEPVTALRQRVSQVAQFAGCVALGL